MNDLEKLQMARDVFQTEINAMMIMQNSLDDVFLKIVRMITTCSGKVIISGMGKPGHIGEKIAATLSSLGTPSFFLHPAEALHGDLGMLSSQDVVIAISYSGESDEIVRLIPNIKLIGSKLIGITANPLSTLGTNSDLVQVLPPFEEACYLHLAPTSSTTVELAYGDALAIVIAKENGFSKEDFACFHPAGALGKKLILKVKDIMCSGQKNAVTYNIATLQEAIVEMSTKQLGIVSIINDNKKLDGIITDGDLRRALERKVDIYNLKATDIMTKTPICVQESSMAVEALRIMKEKKISAMPVIGENGFIVGTVTAGILIRSGLVL